MTVSSFQKQVRVYTHLPAVFLSELAKAATRIPEQQREQIVAELTTGAKRQVSILQKGYKLMASAEKKLRKQVESSEHAGEVSKANTLLK
jgi:hypothetical protein